MLFMYGKAYWDRWGNDEGHKPKQARRGEDDAQGAAAMGGEGDNAEARQRRNDEGDHDSAGDVRQAARMEGDGGVGADGEGEARGESVAREGGEGSEDGGGVGVSERVVRRAGGVRIEDWSEKRRGKRRMEHPEVVALGSTECGRVE